MRYFYISFHFNGLKQQGFIGLTCKTKGNYPSRYALTKIAAARVCKVYADEAEENLTITVLTVTEMESTNYHDFIGNNTDVIVI